MRKLSESIWSDMEDRGTGDVRKKEDSIDLFDVPTLYKYLIDNYESGNNYEPKNPFNIRYFVDSGSISIPVIQQFSHNCYCLKINFQKGEHDEPTFVNLNSGFIKCTPKLYEKLKQNFKTYSREINKTYTQFVICPADGSEYTNTHAINVLNFIIDNIDDEKYLICHHK